MSDIQNNNYVYLHLKGELKKLALTQLRALAKQQKKPDSAKTPPMVLLFDEEPIDASVRELAGFWEADILMGTRGKSALLTLVERKTIFTSVKLLDDFSPINIRKNIEAMFRSIPPLRLKNAPHQSIIEIAKRKIYICNPNITWEKPTIENITYLIFDMLDHEMDFRKFTQEYIDKRIKLLNERPRKALQFICPKEAFKKLMIETKVTTYKN